MIAKRTAQRQQHPVKPVAAEPAHQPDPAALALMWRSAEGLPKERCYQAWRREAALERQSRGPTMSKHRFYIGQIVSYGPASRSQDAPRGAYEITGRLPQGDDGQFEYRIKHSSEAHERIAKEGELSPHD
jgi:hypothetical protein